VKPSHAPSSTLAKAVRTLAAVSLLAGALTTTTVTASRPVPTPIGRGPAYHPAPRGPLATIAGFRCRRGDLRFGLRVHLELFAHRRVVIIPAGIGIDGAQRVRFGHIRAAHCHRPLWTLDPTGVIWANRAELHLGDLFTVWGQPLGPRRLLSFRARPGTTILAFRNGIPLRTAPAQLALRDGDEIVLEIDGYVPPHRSYLFPPRRP
jgi:hypothetical protein